MAETLGSLCDKLTIVKLKQWHSEDPSRLESLSQQEKQLVSEIDELVRSALGGQISPQKLVFPANKVYKDTGQQMHEVAGNIGQMFARLAGVNCALWHEQEKVYDFENVPVPEKDKVVRQLASLNLERNRCIDGIDREFRAIVESALPNSSRKN